MKVPYISNSKDFISSKVFEETPLKKIAPGHLLIVVRGMILAHSFPTAINTVEVSINQDMKAILPIKDVYVIYLKHCLVNMTHQILEVITTAGHGTKKFETDSMGKILIPVPPIELQKQFIAIVGKAEDLKARFTRSLAELENLYNSLSQRAFNGGLNISNSELKIEDETLCDFDNSAPTQTNEFKDQFNTTLEDLIQAKAEKTFSMESLMNDLEQADYYDGVIKYEDIKQQIYKMLKESKLTQILEEVKDDAGKD